jgi:hypothetical protein
MTPSSKEPRAGRLECERRRRGKQIDRARIDAIVAAIAGLPVVDGRSPEELIGYDECGLPRP